MGVEADMYVTSRMGGKPVRLGADSGMGGGPFGLEAESGMGGRAESSMGPKPPGMGVVWNGVPNNPCCNVGIGCIPNAFVPC